MDFSGGVSAELRPSGRLYGNMPSKNTTSESHLLPLSLYNDPPSEAISLEDFEALAADRLRVMGVVEHSLSRGDSHIDTKRKFEEALRESHVGVQSLEEKIQDNISHWVLRLAFSATEDLRRRFLGFECMLFKYRFDEISSSLAKIQAFMAENKLGYEPISKQEKDLHAASLRDIYMINNAWRMKKNAPARGNATSSNRFASVSNATTSSTAFKSFEHLQFYKVEFNHVLDLVGKRQVFLHRGYAYVPETELVHILVSRFRSSMSLRLARAARSLPYINQEDRIRPLLKKLENAYIGPDYGQDSNAAFGSLRLDNLDQHAKQSFPMCMRELHQAFKRDHHLKHFGRLQLYLFLKGLGITMEDCIAYIQSEFIKKPMTKEEFTKRYAYNIRHSYGQEGKRANYRAKSCVSIVMGPQPGPGEFHGCPFKTFSPPMLKAALLRQVPTKDPATLAKVNEIVDRAAKSEFQVACRMHFELQHPGGDSGPVGNHPNAWTLSSLQYFEEKDPSKSENDNNNTNTNAPANTTTEQEQKENDTTSSFSSPEQSTSEPMFTETN